MVAPITVRWTRSAPVSSNGGDRTKPRREVGTLDQASSQAAPLRHTLELGSSIAYRHTVPRSLLDRQSRDEALS